jgi:hypothetical protein
MDFMNRTGRSACVRKVTAAPDERREFTETLSFERLTAGGLLITTGGLACLFATRNASDSTGTMALATHALSHVVLGSALVCAGLLAWLNRGRLIFDRAGRQVQLHYGFPFLFFTRQWSFDDLDSVTMHHKGYDEGLKAWSHLIDIITKAGAKIEVVEQQDHFHDELSARRLGEDLAKFLQVDLIDELTYTQVRRHPDALDESLRDRLKRDGTRSYDAFPVAASRCRVDARPGQVRVDVPPPPFLTVPTAVLIAVGLALTGFVGFGIVPDLVHSHSDTVPYLAGFTALLYFVFMIPVMGPLVERTRNALRWTTIEASPEGLAVTRREVLLKRRNFIASGELEELRLEEVEWKVLAAISDKQVLRFGEGLSQDELVWIHDSLLNALVA